MPSEAPVKTVIITLACLSFLILPFGKLDAREEISGESGISQSSSFFLPGGDFDGDGLNDIGVFRPQDSTWHIRDITVVGFGLGSDYPAVGDYDGDGRSEIALFRSADGLWAVRDLTRIYFGLPGDLPVPGDYDGDGTRDIAVYRPHTGLWDIRGIGSYWFGAEGDLPVPDDYDGDGYSDIGIFRSSSGLWAIRGITRFYYGREGDLPIPGNYDGDGVSEFALYRESSGLWLIRNITRIYFGGPGAIPSPLNYLEPGIRDIAIFNPTAGLWAIKDITRFYYGREGDIPLPGYYREPEPKLGETEEIEKAVEDESEVTTAGPGLKTREKRGNGSPPPAPTATPTPFRTDCGSFSDQSEGDFGLGTYNDTLYNSQSEWVELSDALSGTFTSRVFDAGSASAWTNLSWQPSFPGYKELPSNSQAESGYPSGWADMTGSILVMHFNEQTGGSGPGGADLEDFSGQGHHGTNSGATYGAEGKLNTALSFDGSDDYGSASLGTLNAPFTVEAWGYFNLQTQPSENYDYLLMIGSGSDMISLSRNQSDNRFYSWSENILKYGPVLPGEEWLHIVGVYDTLAPYHRLFINGEEVSVDDFSGAIGTSGELIFGRYNPTSTHYLDGSIDEVAVYERILSDDEVLNHYRRGACRLKFQLRSGQSDPPASGFTGPGGTSGDYYSELDNDTLNPPTFAITNLTSGRYLQYRACFDTDNEDYGPELKSVTIDYCRFTPTPNVTPTPPPTCTPMATATPTATPSVAPVPSPSVPLIDEGFDYFDQGVRPEGWTFAGCNDDQDTYTTGGNYGKNSPSLKLDATNDAIVTKEFSRPDELSFWLKGQGTDTSSALYVEEYYAADWNRVTDIYNLPPFGTIYGALQLNPGSNQVRFTYSKSSGDLAFDDVRITELATPSPIPTATATPSATPAPTPSPTITPTPTPSVTPTPSPTMTPTPTPSVTPTHSPTLTPTPTQTPTSTPTPSVSPPPTATPSPSPIPWDGGLLDNPGYEFWDETGTDAYYWSWDKPDSQWTRSTDAYYAGSSGLFSREAATEGNLDQFGKTMSQGVMYYAALMVKGSGELRIGIRYPHNSYSSYGDWTSFSGDGWTMLEHEAAPTGSGSNGGLRIQVRECFEPNLLIDNAYLDDSHPFPTPTASPTASPTVTPTVTPPPTPTPSPTPTATPIPTSSPTPEGYKTPSPTPTPSVTPEGYKTPTPTPSATPHQYTGEVRIMAANLSYGWAPVWYGDEAKRIFQGLKPDIVLIQEFNAQTTSDIDTFVSEAFGDEFYYYVEPQGGGDYAMPNGIISRWGFQTMGEWADQSAGLRDFAWGVIELPNEKIIQAVSVHAKAGTTEEDREARYAEAVHLKNLVAENFDDNQYIVVGGDFNFESEPQSPIEIYGSFLEATQARPADRNGNTDTNSTRTKPFDWIMPNDLLGNEMATFTLGTRSYINGIVFDSQVYTPLSDVSPIEYGDSHTTGIYHMAVMKRFQISGTPTPTPPDADDDEILGAEEVIPGDDGYITDPNNPDTDGDKLIDGNNITVDSGDYRYNAWAVETTGYLYEESGSNRLFFGERDAGTDPTEADTDADGIDDGDEYYFWTINGWAPQSDIDGDFWANILDPDADGDGMPDGWEYYYYCVDGTTFDAYTDPDGDGFNNITEYREGTDPCDINSAPPGSPPGAYSPGCVVINEVVTDPQADWNDSTAPGEGEIPFNNNPGTGMINHDDEWIELFNTQTDAAAIDLTGWTLFMKDISYNLFTFSEDTSSSVLLRFTGQWSSLTGFQNEDYLVIGNPTGAMDDKIFLELRDGAGTLIDTAELGDDWEEDGDGDGAPDGSPIGGAANDIAAEAIARVPNGEDSDPDEDGSPAQADVDDFVRQAASIGGPNQTPETYSPGTVVINELVLDPQSDWNDTTGGNGVPFDAIPGAGGITAADQWIEFFNTHTDTVNLSGWTLRVGSGDPVTTEGQSLGAGTAILTFSNSGSLAALAPGEFMVLGDPFGHGGYLPEVCFIELRDALGNTIDTVELGDDPEEDGDGDGAPDGSDRGGESTGSGDEAIYRYPDGRDTDNDVADFYRGYAGIGGANYSPQTTASGSVVINEIVTDPKHDWNDSTGGNGVAFDNLPGTGAIDPDDQWIELYNASPTALDLTGWLLTMHDAESYYYQAEEIIGAGEATLVFNPSSALTDFQPADYLVVGNPDGVMNNRVLIELWDSQGALVDRVELGDDPAGDGEGDGAPDGGPAGGRAAGPSVEAIARLPVGQDTDDDPADFVQQSATIGYVNQSAYSNSPGSALINEVVTQPQRDWNDSTGGNGIAFDSVPGTGEPGVDDEWIEIYNDSGGIIDLSGWYLKMWNSATSIGVETLGSGGADLVFSPASGLNSFQPDDYLVVGDPSGVLTNQVYIQLFDPAGNLIDDVESGDDPEEDGEGDGAPGGDSGGGYSRSIYDESIARVPNGWDQDTDVADFLRTLASIGAENPSAPPDPVITGISPDEGYYTGGTPVLIDGYHLGSDSETTTWVGETTLVEQYMINEYQIWGRTGWSSSTGLVDVTVNVSGRQDVLEDGFTYRGFPPSQNPTIDTDDDGLTDEEEAELGTDENLADTDGDGIDDGAERDYWESQGASPLDDCDNDGTVNILDYDSDNDGISDGAEIDQGTDPCNDDTTAPVILIVDPQNGQVFY